MTGRTAPIAAALAWAALAAAPDSAAAQCRLCATPSTEVEETARQPVLLQVEATLDFDRLILMRPGDGVAALLPDGTRSVGGSLSGLGGRAMVGTISVRGEPLRAIRVEMPRRLELHSRGGGGKIVVDELETDLPRVPRLDSAGRLIFRFGGRLQVGSDAEGDYRGEVPITVEYL